MAISKKDREAEEARARDVDDCLTFMGLATDAYRGGDIRRYFGDVVYVDGGWFDAMYALRISRGLSRRVKPGEVSGRWSASFLLTGEPGAGERYRAMSFATRPFLELLRSKKMGVAPRKATIMGTGFDAAIRPGGEARVVSKQYYKVGEGDADWYSPSTHYVKTKRVMTGRGAITKRARSAKGAWCRRCSSPASPSTPRGCSPASGRRPSPTPGTRGSSTRPTPWGSRASSGSVTCPRGTRGGRPSSTG